MNKTTEALKLAEETLRDIIRVYKFETGTPVTALAAIREVLADHIASTGKMVSKPVDAVEVTDLSEPEGCDYCKHPIFAGTKCNNCGRVTLAEPVKQEPVAVISESAIGLVKLHSNGACLPFGTQLYAAPVDAKDIRAEVLREVAKLCDRHAAAELIGSDVHCALKELAAAIRGLK